MPAVVAVLCPVFLATLTAACSSAPARAPVAQAPTASTPPTPDVPIVPDACALTREPATTGAICGRVVSQTSSGAEPVRGVTIVATSPALAGPQSTLSDPRGRFHLPDLPPGLYTVTFYFADLAIPRHHITVASGRATAITPTTIPPPTSGLLPLHGAQPR